MTTARVMNDKPSWEQEGPTWPNSAASRFVEAGGLTWHVQIAGQGPVLLLLHGTAASTHSWGGLFPLLAEHATVVAPDLPGHGFTTAPDPRRLSLPGMAANIDALLHTLQLKPEIVVGHSAGAAILAWMCLDGALSPRLLVSLAGALLPLRGTRGKWFSPAAKLMARSSLVPRFVAYGAKRDPKGVQRLAAGTGSNLSPTTLELYRRLVASPGHLAAALNMMANWELEPLRTALPRLKVPTLLVGFSNDKTIPPEDAEDAHALIPQSELRLIGGFGHLAHEEDPETIAELILHTAELDKDKDKDKD